MNSDFDTDQPDEQDEEQEQTQVDSPAEAEYPDEEYPDEEEEFGAPLEELMGDADGGDFIDLDQTALEAAEQVLSEDPNREEDLPNWADEPFEDAPAEYAEANENPQNVRNDRVLIGLLFLNLALLGAMLALPSSPSSTAPQQPTRQPRTAGSDPFVQPPRNLTLPTSELWEASVRAAASTEPDNYKRAAQLLEHHLRVSRNMSDLERQLVYNQLALYLVKDGRVNESREYSVRAQQLMARSYLPEDLLHGAKRAAEAGMVTEMRSSYARFLLQLKQASPALRKAKAEAYLKLGDSYRLEAEQAEKQAEQATLDRAMGLRDTKKKADPAGPEKAPGQTDPQAPDKSKGQQGSRGQGHGP